VGRLLRPQAVQRQVALGAAEDHDLQQSEEEEGVHDGEADEQASTGEREVQGAGPPLAGTVGYTGAEGAGHLRSARHSTEFRRAA
jgi:hypothetical protein